MNKTWIPEIGVLALSVTTETKAKRKHTHKPPNLKGEDIRWVWVTFPFHTGFGFQAGRKRPTDPCLPSPTRQACENFDWRRNTLCTNLGFQLMLFLLTILNNALFTPVSDRGGASWLGQGSSISHDNQCHSTSPHRPIPHFLLCSQRYVVLHWKALCDYSNKHYINNKWNAIESESSWTPGFGLLPKAGRFRHAKAAPWTS